MAEERIIDDEYGRGVKLRKTKDGFVDVTDEALDKTPDEAENVDGAEETGEEISFAFPMLEGEEDDEDLVGLTPEQAVALRKQKAEAATRRRAEYEKLVAEGNRLLETGNFHSAELTFEKALQLDEPATDASVGYWRAKTEDFTKPDVLIEEYVEAGIESLEYDLGYEAAEIVKRDYRHVFEKRFEELKAEEEPLFMEVNAKQERRRSILKERRKKSIIGFIAVGVPTLVCIILAVIFGLKNFSTPDDTYVPVTIVLATVSAVLFIVFGAVTNKMINTFRIYRTNEKLTSTDEGERLAEIMEYKNLYGELLNVYYDGEGEEIVEEQTEEIEDNE